MLTSIDEFPSANQIRNKYKINLDHINQIFNAINLAVEKEQSCIIMELKINPVMVKFLQERGFNCHQSKNDLFINWV